ncbi:hypothetical protein CR513_46835, partial [Mucuna pruriens]
MSPYQIVFGKTCHLPSTKPARLSNSAIWLMTKLESKGNSNCKSERNSAWKHMRIPGSISRKPRNSMTNRS